MAGKRRKNIPTLIETRESLHRLAAYLKLNEAEIAQMLGSDVDEAMVRQWMHENVDIHPVFRKEIASANRGLNLLLKIFKPERLADVIRRPAPAFNGERALDLILRGRIREVARHYDTSTHYQS